MAENGNEILATNLRHLGSVANIFAVFGLGVAVPLFGWYTKKRKRKTEQHDNRFVDVSKRVTNPIKQTIEDLAIHMQIQSEQNEAIIENLERFNLTVKDLSQFIKELDKNMKDQSRP